MPGTLEGREKFRVFDEQLQVLLGKLQRSEPFADAEKTHIAFCLGAVWMRACENVGLDTLETDKPSPRPRSEPDIFKAIEIGSRMPGDAASLWKLFGMLRSALEDSEERTQAVIAQIHPVLHALRQSHLLEDKRRNGLVVLQAALEHTPDLKGKWFTLVCAWRDIIKREFELDSLRAQLVEAGFHLVGKEATAERFREIQTALEGVRRVESPSGRVWLDEQAVRAAISKVLHESSTALEKSLLDALEEL